MKALIKFIKANMCKILNTQKVNKVYKNMTEEKKNLNAPCKEPKIDCNKNITFLVWAKRAKKHN
jgi:hypothetical protein